MDAIEKFKVLIRKEFQFLCDDFEFKEEGFNTYNEYSISYANSTTRVIVEVVNRGANVRVALGSLSYHFEDYDLGDIATIDNQDAWDSFVSFDMPQNEQLSYLHSFLIICGKDILAGNFAIFPQLNEIRKQRLNDFDKHK